MPTADAEADDLETARYARALAEYRQWELAVLASLVADVDDDASSRQRRRSA